MFNYNLITNVAKSKLNCRCKYTNYTRVTKLNTGAVLLSMYLYVHCIY